MIALIALLAIRGWTSDDRPPTVRVTPDPAGLWQGGAGYHLPVEIANTGNQVAEDVEARIVHHDPSGATVEAAFRFDFLAGGATKQAVAVFPGDPRTGRLEVAGVAFRTP